MPSIDAAVGFGVTLLLPGLPSTAGRSFALDRRSQRHPSLCPVPRVDGVAVPGRRRTSPFPADTTSVRPAGEAARERARAGFDTRRITRRLLDEYEALHARHARAG